MKNQLLLGLLLVSVTGVTVCKPGNDPEVSVPRRRNQQKILRLDPLLLQRHHQRIAERDNLRMANGMLRHRRVYGYTGLILGAATVATAAAATGCTIL